MYTKVLNTISRALVEDKEEEPRKKAGEKMNSSLSSEKEATQ